MWSEINKSPEMEICKIKNKINLTKPSTVAILRYFDKHSGHFWMYEEAKILGILMDATIYINVDMIIFWGKIVGIITSVPEPHWMHVQVSSLFWVIQ